MKPQGVVVEATEYIIETKVKDFQTNNRSARVHQEGRNVWEVHYYAGWSAAGQRKPTARFPTKRGALHSARRWVRENK